MQKVHFLLGNESQLLKENPTRPLGRGCSHAMLCSALTLVQSSFTGSVLNLTKCCTRQPPFEPLSIFNICKVRS
jgi:hypothetical protein